MVRKRVRLIDPDVQTGEGLAGIAPFAQKVVAASVASNIGPLLQHLAAIPDLKPQEREAYMKTLLEHYGSRKNLLYKPLATVLAGSAGKAIVSGVGSAAKLAGRVGSAAGKVLDPRFGDTFAGAV